MIASKNCTMLFSCRAFASCSSTSYISTTVSTTSPTSTASQLPVMHWQTSLLRYSRAYVRGLAPNFAAEALRSAASSSPPIDQQKAIQQHEAYVQALQKCIPTPITVIPPAEGGCADSVFIEDTAVIVGNTALLTRPGAKSRRNEVDGVEQFLKSSGLQTFRMPLKSSSSPAATLDGGDVLFTGREFFVGLSSRTNEAGVEYLARTFPGFRVIPVPLASLIASGEKSNTVTQRKNKLNKQKNNANGSSSGSSSAAALHLKSLLSLAGPDTIVIADNELGHALAFYLQDHSGVSKAVRATGGRLSFVLVPDVECTNVVFANGTLLIPPAAQYPSSAEVLYEYASEVGFSVAEVDTSELAKADGALTCCSLLVN